MRILRYRDPLGAIHHARLHDDGSRERLEGEGLRPSPAP